MPVYPALHKTEFLRLVRVANPTYNRVKTSSLAPLITVLDSATGNAAQVAAAITNIRAAADATYVNKANKYRQALTYLQRTYPVPLGQWVPLGASRARAVRYTQAPMPLNFNPHGPGMYNNVQRVVPASAWEGAVAQSVEDFIYRSIVPVGAVLIHVDAHQGGMDTLIDGVTVLTHMKRVLRAIADRGWGACALHIGATPPVLPALQPEFNACPAHPAVNETGHRHMGGAHAAFNNFVTGYATVIMMGFDADVCVRANLFGATEYPVNPLGGPPAPNTPALAPVCTQADVVTSRAVLVTPGTIGIADYGPIVGY